MQIKHLYHLTLFLQQYNNGTKTRENKEVVVDQTSSSPGQGTQRQRRNMLALAQVSGADRGLGLSGGGRSQSSALLW